jgi:hypothetical protein
MKPRAFRSDVFVVRAECVISEDGERTVDTSIDLFDDATTADDLKRYGQWLIKASKWLKEKNSANAR